jgi:predicted RNA-binding protein with PUA-like domain
MKSEPEAFSIEALEAMPKQSSMWDGVRNYQARNIMRDQMQIGDLAFFYHSNAKPSGIAGIVAINSEAYPDPTQFDARSKYFDEKSTPKAPRWFLRDVKFVCRVEPMISLEELKGNSKLKNMMVTQQGSRLSVQPVRESEWDEILKMANIVIARSAATKQSTKKQVVHG